MTTKRRSFTVYSIRDSIQGQPVTAFNDVIQEQVFQDPSLETYDIEPGYNFDARLYVLVPSPREPDWVDFLREGFATLQVPETAANRAVMIIKVNYYNKDRYFAFTFGAGRHLLKPDCYERDFGLRSALNVIYKGDDSESLVDSTRIRRVDSKTVSSNTLHTRRQVNRLANFDVFNFDIEVDLLRAVTGLPTESGEWGSRISGSDALYLSVEADISNIGDLCKRIWWIGRRADSYKTRFEWLDDIKFIQDEETLEQLETNLISALKSSQFDDLTLAPPELIEWEGLEFRYSFSSDRPYQDLELSDFLLRLEEQDKLDDLDIDKLKKAYRVEAFDNQGILKYSWPVWRCLDGELVEKGISYILDAGDFYVIAPDFMGELDDYIRRIDESAVNLPDSKKDSNGKELDEGPYNSFAADTSPGYLLMDKETVRVDNLTSPIEVCDILTSEKQFIHVKRKLQSKSLSHLFAQGSVSADLYKMSEEYREKVVKRVSKIEKDLADATNNDALRGVFSGVLSLDVPITNQYEVVYAIIEKWDGRRLVDALPFFSKVNLRRHTDSLRRMGYEVTYKRIEVVEA